MKQRIQNILIANRAEIACRIITTCRRMGIKTVSMYTKKEAGLPHALYADEAILLEGETLKETYLNIQQIVEIAKKAGADAIHPGYGFLSENAEFAAGVNKSGIIFIGPSAENIRMMGDKKIARLKAQELGVPVVPGFDGEAQDAKTLLKAAEKIGWPVLIKAAAGGGGKGMKVASEAKQFEAMLELAKSEAKSSFGDDRVILEKYLEEPRHIEIQVFSDSKGNHLHLFERECSIQRRHQKIIEESPAPNLPQKTREAMYDAALKLTKGIGYLGAGTVEMIMDKHGAFYFLEMNTRLQVEHPVTEAVTGLDLVRLQIEVAEGTPLPFKQSEITSRGSAIEARLYAEDANNAFLPTTGRVEKLYFPKHPNLRVDSGISEGNSVSVDFDPMIAKVIASGASRNEAIENLAEAISETEVSGLITNRQFLLEILENQHFIKGETSTAFIEKHLQELFAEKHNDEDIPLVIAAYIISKANTFSHNSGSVEVAEHTAWANPSLKNFRNC